jgi:hypothetical protein
MNKQVLRVGGLSLFFAVAGTLLLGCATTDMTGRREALQISVPAADKAKVVFFRRGSGHKYGIFTIHDSDRAVGNLSYKTYFAYECDPGHHMFSTALENVAMLDAELTAGRVYYVEVIEKVGWVMPSVQMEPVYPGCKGNRWKDLPKLLGEANETLLTAAEQEVHRQDAAKYMDRINKYRQEQYLKKNPRPQILAEYGQIKPVGTTQ